MSAEGWEGALSGSGKVQGVERVYGRCCSIHQAAVFFFWTGDFTIGRKRPLGVLCSRRPVATYLTATSTAPF